MRSARAVPFFLRIRHAQWLMMISLTALVAAQMLVGLDGWISDVVRTATSLLIALDCQAMLVHRPRVPWCPYCRDEGWGDEPDTEPENVPDPTPPGAIGIR